MNSRLLPFLICLLGLTLSKSCFPQNYVGEELNGFISVSKPTCFIDDSGDLRLAEVANKSFNDSIAEAFEALKKINFQRNVWVRFDLQIENSELDDTIAVSVPFFSHVRIYFIHENGRIDSTDVGLEDIGNYYSSDQDQTLALLTPEKSEKVTVFIKVSHRARIVMVSQFWISVNKKNFFDNRKTANRPSRTGSSYFYILFCGVLLFQLVYVLLQWYLVRRREYFYYALYILTVLTYYYMRFCVYYAESSGWVLFEAKQMIDFNDILLILPTIFYLRFARAFVDLKTRDRKLYGQFSGIEIFLWVCLIAQVVILNIPNDFNKIILVLAALIVQFPFILYALIRISRQRRKLVWFLIVGSSIAFSFHLTANLMPYLFSGLMKVVSPLELSMIGITFEIIIFNTGLLFKARESEVDRIVAQESYIEELKNRQRLQEEFNSVRDEIASDLHDDVGSSLSSIGIYTYAAKEKLKTEGKDQIRELLDNIQRSAASTLNSMSDLVWATNPRNDSNEKLIERIKAFGYEILSPIDCVFQSSVDPEFFELSLNQAERKNILLILKEAINNSAKYSDASEVQFQIHVEQDHFTIVLSDNGRGFNMTTAKSGNGMRTMKKRSEEIGAKFQIISGNEGTSIEITVKK